MKKKGFQEAIQEMRAMMGTNPASNVEEKLKEIYRKIDNGEYGQDKIIQEIKIKNEYPFRDAPKVEVCTNDISEVIEKVNEIIKYIKERDKYDT